MNRGILAATRGMHASQTQLDVIANNLANVNTAGFKRDGLTFADTMERQMALPGAPSWRIIGTLGTGADIKSRWSDNSVGAAQQTGNPLDLMLEDENQYFAVQTPAGIRFTRNGAFTANGEGQLTTQDGHPVLDVSGQPIVLSANGSYNQVGVSKTGVVSVDGIEVGVLDVRQGNLRKVGNSLWDGKAEQVAEPRIQSGMLEGSNVNAIQSMVEMILLMRSYESSQKAVKTQDEATEKLLQGLSAR